MARVHSLGNTELGLTTTSSGSFTGEERGASALDGQRLLEVVGHRDGDLHVCECVCVRERVSVFECA